MHIQSTLVIKIPTTGVYCRDIQGSIFVIRPNQTDPFTMTPKVEFSKYNINILHVVKFTLRNVKYCKRNMPRNMHGEQQNKTCFMLKTKAILKRIFQHRYFCFVIAQLFSQVLINNCDLFSTIFDPTRGSTKSVDISSWLLSQTSTAVCHQIALLPVTWTGGVGIGLLYIRLFVTKTEYST